jgi:hypothetical protein
MRSSQVAVLVLALVLAAGAVLVAGCGGGGSSSESSAAKAAPAGQKRHSSEGDCSSLSHITTDLAMADAGFDYARDREFIDDYADRAPDEISDSVKRLRDILDKFASAAEKAGLKPNKAPLPDQAEKVKDEMDYSDGEQTDNGRALDTVNTWVMNGCSA